eukprot:1085455-Pelagomonas_calceolata.AAC.3
MDVLHGRPPVFALLSVPVLCLLSSSLKLSMLFRPRLPRLPSPPPPGPSLRNPCCALPLLRWLPCLRGRAGPAPHSQAMCSLLTLHRLPTVPPCPAPPVAAALLLCPMDPATTTISLMIPLTVQHLPSAAAVRESSGQPGLPVMALRVSGKLSSSSSSSCTTGWGSSLRRPGMSRGSSKAAPLPCSSSCPLLLGKHTQVCAMMLCTWARRAMRGGGQRDACTCGWRGNA